MIQSTTETIDLCCACCGLPFARLQAGCLVVQSIHSGHKHVNMIAVTELVRLVEQPGPRILTITSA